MLSLFAVPKAFVGDAAILQNNAIESWTRLPAACEIVLFGRDEGVAEAAARHGVKYEPEIAYNEFGTPFLSDIFTRMNALAKFSLLAFVNADIILMSDFLSSVRTAMQSRDRFLLVASRYNCRIEQPLLFQDNWEIELRARVRGENRMYPAAGSDLFVFPRELFSAIPNFSIGRGYWDNWLMREARRMHVSLIDATAALTAVHQEHSYGHIPGFSADTDGRLVYESEEGRRNLQLTGGHSHLYTLFDATEVITTDGRLLSTWSMPLAYRRAKAALRRVVGLVCR